MRRPGIRDLRVCRVADESHAEIRDFHLCVRRAQDVGWLDVAMDDVVAKRVIERPGTLEADFHYFGDGKQAARAGVLRQAATGDKFCDDITHGVVRAGIHDQGDMRVP